MGKMIKDFEVERQGNLILLRRFRANGTEAESIPYTMTSLRALIPMWEISPSGGPDAGTINKMMALMKEIEGE